MPYSTSTKNPEVSVVICHHTGDLLQRFMLPSLFKSEGITYEVIILTSDEALASEGIDGCLVMHDTRMPAAKRNAGVRLSRAKFVAFFDDDVELAKDTLRELRNGFGEGDVSSVGMVYGKLWNMERRDRFDEAGSYLTRTGFLWSRAGQNNVDSGQYDKEEYCLSGKSASCMVKKWIFNKVGGFDEDFGILGEETDLSWRIWLDGQYVLYEPLAVGWHAFNTKFKPQDKHYTSERVQFNGCRNYLTMLIKNLERKSLWRILPVHLLIWSFAGVAMLFTGKWKQSFNIFKGIGYIVWKQEDIWKKRQIIQDRRVKSDRDIWPHIFHSPPRAYYIKRFFRYLSIGLHG